MTSTRFIRATITATIAAAIFVLAPANADAADSPLERVRAKLAAMDRSYDGIPGESRIVVVINRNGSDTRSGAAVLAKLVDISDEIRTLLSLDARFSSPQKRADADGLIALVGKLGEKHEDEVDGNLSVASARNAARRAALELERRVDNLIEIISRFREKTSEDRRQDSDETDDGAPSRAHWRRVWQGHIDDQVDHFRRLVRAIDQLERSVDQSAAASARRVRDFDGNDDVEDALGKIDGKIEALQTALDKLVDEEKKYKREFRDWVDAAEKEEDAKKRKRLYKLAEEAHEDLISVAEDQVEVGAKIDKLTPDANKLRDISENFNNAKLVRLRDAAAAWASERE
jgi:hypothetical protein